MEKKPKIFVIMPFGDTFFESYEMIKNHFQKEYDFSNAAAEDNQQCILTDIFIPLYEADIVLADLTGLNPNVMYELGMAHSFGKKTITITQDELEKLPFDLKQYRAKKYSTYFKHFMELLEYLDKNFSGAVNGTVTYRNPIQDTLEAANKKMVMPEQNAGSLIRKIEEGEKGFLDFFAEIEDDSNKMTTNVQCLVNEFEKLNTGINKSANDINKVSGSGKVAFIRKEAKRIAELLSVFQQKLQSHNNQNTDLWNNIETNTLALLENEHIQEPNFKKGLVTYLNSLNDLKSATSQARTNLNTVMQGIKQLRSIERTLTQTINFIEEDFKSFSNWTEQIEVGINRIFAKSRFVIGDME